MGGRKCRVCDEAQSKYKCPSCLIPYCSLICFKKHKEIPCVRPVPSSEANLAPGPSISPGPGPGPALHVQRPYYVDEPSMVLQQLQLESIASSSEVRDALKDQELQKLILHIDSSPYADNELEKAMEVDAFRSFAEKYLVSIFGSKR